MVFQLESAPLGLLRPGEDGLGRVHSVFQDVLHLPSIGHVQKIRQNAAPVTPGLKNNITVRRKSSCGAFEYFRLCLILNSPHLLIMLRASIDLCVVAQYSQSYGKVAAAGIAGWFNLCAILV